MREQTYALFASVRQMQLRGERERGDETPKAMRNDGD